MSKILVIDDRQGNLTTVRATIEDAIPDCHVIDAMSGKEGIELARREQPDVILLDVVMPEMDGYEVCKRLKANDLTRHIHVILISAYQTDSKSKVKGFSAGADAFLIRPIERAELAAHLSSMLRITRTEQLLKEALEQARESDRLKSAFLATMSHELRTPLNAILGFSGLLDKNTPGEEVERFARIIHEKGNILLKLVEDLFEITLIQTGEIRINKQEVNILSILAGLIAIAKRERVRLGKEKIGIRVIPANQMEDLVLYTDPERVKQILVNLIKNALKFTREGSIEFGCRREIWKSQQRISFYVKDTGIGISHENFKFIFNLFRQVDESNTRPCHGAGIGLFISKRLTDLLGGELWVESKEGVGSTFFFSLPGSFADHQRMVS
ncbi:MAG: hybrid sensor histidine kinase/response regulator [bacterium]